MKSSDVGFTQRLGPGDGPASVGRGEGARGGERGEWGRGGAGVGVGEGGEEEVFVESVKHWCGDKSTKGKIKFLFPFSLLFFFLGGGGAN